MPTQASVSMRDFVDSEQWEVFLNQVVAPEAHQLWAGLKSLTLPQADQGPLLAAQLRLLERLLRNMYELAGVRDESERAMREMNQMREIGNG